MSLDSSVDIAKGCGRDNRRSSPEKVKVFIYKTVSTPSPTSLPYNMYRGPFLLGKREGCKADHSVPTTVVVKNCGAVPLLPHKCPWRHT
jgi:hypothetical protein